MARRLEEFKMIPLDSELYGNAQINIGIILKREGKIAQAIEVMERAIRNNRDMPGLYVYLSSLYEEDKKLSSAEGNIKGRPFCIASRASTFIIVSVSSMKRQTAFTRA